MGKTGFIDFNYDIRTVDFYALAIDRAEILRELSYSIKSGLTVDIERGILIKEGYGAVVGCCPDN